MMWFWALLGLVYYYSSFYYNCIIRTGPNSKYVLNACH